MVSAWLGQPSGGNCGFNIDAIREISARASLKSSTPVDFTRLTIAVPNWMMQAMR
jgi:hypothetical protein